MQGQYLWVKDRDRQFVSQSVGQLLGWVTTATVAQLANSTQALQTGDMLCLHTIIQTTVAAISLLQTQPSLSWLRSLGKSAQ